MWCLRAIIAIGQQFVGWRRLSDLVGVGWCRLWDSVSAGPWTTRSQTGCLEGPPSRTTQRRAWGRVPGALAKQYARRGSESWSQRAVQFLQQWQCFGTAVLMHTVERSQGVPRPSERAGAYKVTAAGFQRACEGRNQTFCQRTGQRISTGQSATLRFAFWPDEADAGGAAGARVGGALAGRSGRGGRSSWGFCSYRKLACFGRPRCS